eukprot:m.272873 g.272873  ORF g.272873 m.272873 type:complete len:141 (-) comp11088_c1_seq19:21-443(-)
MLTTKTMCVTLGCVGLCAHPSSSNVLLLQQGWTPLHQAANYDFQESAVLLLAHGADIHCKNRSGETPLHRAAINGCMNTAVLLITHHADINCANNVRCMPLMAGPHHTPGLQAASAHLAFPVGWMDASPPSGLERTSEHR